MHVTRIAQSSMLAAGLLATDQAGAQTGSGSGLPDHLGRLSEIVAGLGDPEEAVAILPRDAELATEIVADRLRRSSRAGTAAAPGDVVPSDVAFLRVGGDAACDHADPAAAIAAAAGLPDWTVIRLANNAEYTEQRLRIVNRNVILEGGYADCSADEPTEGNTVLDGSRSTGRPVIRVLNLGGERAAGLRLHRLTLQGGSTADANFNCSESDHNGAGLNIRGRVQADLFDTIVRNNRTSGGTGGIFCGDVRDNWGGGIYMESEGFDDAHLQLHSGSGVINNRAGRNGGGIAARATKVVLADPDVAVALNRSGDLFEENLGGGGIYLSLSSLRSSAGGILMGIWGNEARSGGNGGGVYAPSGASFAPAEPDAFRPVLVGNLAEGDGGGLYQLIGSSELVDTLVAGNHAGGEGGGLLVGPGELVMRRSQAPCSGAPVEHCSRLHNNSADGDGGALSQGHRFVESSVKISQTTISGNSSGGLGSVAHVRGPEAETVLDSVAIHGNHGSSRLFQLVNGPVMTIGFSTIAGNRRPDDPALQVFRVLEFDGSPTGAVIHRSIVWEPGATIVHPDGDADSVAVCVVGHQPEAEAGFSFANSYSRIDPRLEDPAGGNLRLRADSPAIDYCGGAPGVDLFGEPRGVRYDGSTVTPPNPGDGDFDLGIHERQAAAS